MAHIWLLISTLFSISLFLPSLQDKNGWALRVRFVDSKQYYLTNECFEGRELEVLLMNCSANSRSYVPLLFAGNKKDLRVTLRRVDGKPLAPPGSSFRGLPPKDLPLLATGEIHSFRFMPIRAGFSTFEGTGDYVLGASLKTAEGQVEAPPFKLKVVEPKPDDVLESKQVALEGEVVRWPKASQERGYIQQIKIGSRSWLFYRRYNSDQSGGGIHAAFRICELPGKVFDLKVEGAFGDSNPLTITYRENSFTKFTTTHVIHSTNGRPWTAEEEKHRQERLKKLAPVPEKK